MSNLSKSTVDAVDSSAADPCNNDVDSGCWDIIHDSLVLDAVDSCAGDPC